MILRHEINLLNVSTAVTANTDYLYSVGETYVSAFNGTLTGYIEVQYNGTSLEHRLLRTNDGTTMDSVTGGSSGTNLLLRSPGFSITSDFLFQYQTGPGGSGTVKSVKLIIKQDTGGSNLTASQSQYEIGSRETGKINTVSAGLTAPKYWKYNAANFDGTVTFAVDLTWSLSGTGTGTITLQESSATLTAPTWTDKLTIVSAGISATPSKLVSGTFTPVDGRMYRIASFNSSSMGSLGIYLAKILVTQTGSDITKTEENYLLANTTLAAGTALQVYWTKWDSAEWSGVTNTYLHEAYASDGNTSVVEVDTAAGTQVTGSSLSTIDNIKTSTAITMPANGNLDTKATTNSGSVYGNKIVVTSVKSTGVTVTTKRLALLGVG